MEIAALCMRGDTMKKFEQFDTNKRWYKANFHAHSTRSDGLLTPEQMIKCYKEQGYSILTLSEHEKYTDTEEFDTNDMIVYPGIERSIELPDKEAFHIHGIANYSEECSNRYRHDEYIPVPKYNHMQDVQTIIDEVKERGNFVMLNHPYWSFNTFEHLQSLNNYDFIEVYNHNCHIGTDHGNNEIFFDELLKYKNVKAVAADDNHNSNRYIPGVHMWDSFGGFTMLQLDEFSRKGISDALKNGRFYASSGPEIYQFSRCGNEISVTCSKLASIVFKAWPKRGYCIQPTNDNGCSTATYALRGGEKWIRVKCIDEKGRCAWSNPIYLED